MYGFTEYICDSLTLQLFNRSVMWLFSFAIIRYQSQAIRIMEIEQQENNTKIGMITFIHEINLNEIQRTMAKGTKEGRLTIDWGDYQRQGWSERVTQISVIEAKEFLIWNNRRPTILKEFQHVAFDKLTILVLGNNHIKSVEYLAHFRLPVLQNLNLCSNFIVSTRPFAKISIPTLKTLKLQDNPISDFEHLYRADFKSLQNLEISKPGQFYDKFKTKPDTVTWKIKLPFSLKEDKQYYDTHYRHYLRNPQMHRDLKFTKYRDALKKKYVQPNFQSYGAEWA